MKRSKALAPLSRDHHRALVVARDLTRATDATAASAANRFVEFLEHHEAAHFALEEAVLLPLIPDAPPGGAMAQRMVEDHEFLRNAMRELRASASAPDTASLHLIGQRLRDHVQMEEQQLFPYLEALLSATALAEVGSRLQAAG